ncbi:MAG TPA: hypothetical protein VMV99_10730 [Rhodanobacter sp.]|nr:hypothetical protein [Rhodanobacter sp.]
MNSRASAGDLVPLGGDAFAGEAGARRHHAVGALDRCWFPDGKTIVVPVCGPTERAAVVDRSGRWSGPFITPCVPAAA